VRAVWNRGRRLARYLPEYECAARAATAGERGQHSILHDVQHREAGPVTNLGSCCILGYHGNTSALPIQAYSPTDFDTTGLFGPTVGDSNTLSHEAGEFINDPFGNNPTPAWGGVGQVPPGFCQHNLEVGDPLTGFNFSPIGGRNGFTYHLQELTFF
jgi:hypothetical protein